MKKIALFILCIGLYFVCHSCSNETEYIEVEKVVKDTIYINKTVRDTLYIDKIIKDTVINNVHDTLYVDKIIKDTIYIEGSTNVPQAFKTWQQGNENQYKVWLTEAVSTHDYYNQYTGKIAQFKVDYVFVFYGTIPIRQDSKYNGTKMVTMIGVTGDKISLIHAYNITNNTKISDLSTLYPPTESYSYIQFNISFFPTNTYIGKIPQ